MNRIYMSKNMGDSRTRRFPELQTRAWVEDADAAPQNPLVLQNRLPHLWKIGSAAGKNARIILIEGTK